MVATLQRDPQVTHCRNCPLNCSGICTAPRSGYPIHPDMPAGRDCHRDIEALGQRDAEYKNAKAQAKSNFEAYWAGSISTSVQRDVAAGRAIDERAMAQEELVQHIDEQAEAIAPEYLSDADKIKIAQHLQTVGGIYGNLYRVDPANIESKLNPTPGKYGKGYVDLTFGQHLSSYKLRSGKYSDWFAGGSCVMPIKISTLLAILDRPTEKTAEKAPVRMPVTDMGKMAYLQKLQATLPPHKQNRVAAIFTIDDKPRMRAVTICYQANYLLADGRKAVMFYEHGKEPTDVIRTMANVPVWVIPTGMRPNYKTWRVELIGTIDGIPEAA